MNEQKKSGSILKPIAIAGFIAIIILIAWLSIQLVHTIPSAFSSLASLAEIVNDQEEVTNTNADAVATLGLTSNATITSVGEPVTISWGEPSVPGTFTFSYACTTGVAVDLVNVEGMRSIDCDTNYNIGNITELTITVDSEKERYADLSYTIAFLGTNDTIPRASGSAILTVINSGIENVLVTATEEPATPEWIEPEEVEEPEIVTPTQPEVSEPTTPVVTPTAPTPATPTYEQEYIYTIPVSDPNGRVDLATRFLNTGEIVNNAFVAKALESNEAGAIQFEVKNVGTKTSGTWTYSVTLPDGSTYNAPAQQALKPNERAVLTIGFSASNVTSHRFEVIVKEATDQTTLNNQFSQTIAFTR